MSGVYLRSGTVQSIWSYMVSLQKNGLAQKFGGSIGSADVNALFERSLRGKITAQKHRSFNKWISSSNAIYTNQDDMRNLMHVSRF